MLSAARRMLVDILNASGVEITPLTSRDRTKRLTQLPYWFVHGVVYRSPATLAGMNSAMERRRASRIDDAFDQIASFMIRRNPVSWRWGHACNHSDTIIVGRDPEIACCARPMSFGCCWPVLACLT